MKVGIVKWFKQEEGYGVITTLHDSDFFVHRPKNLHLFQEGVAVQFDAVFDEERQRATAVNVSILVSTTAWCEMMNYLSVPHCITIERKSYNLIRIATAQLFTNNEDAYVIDSLIHYYNEFLNKKLFIEYCDILNAVQAQNKLDTTERALKKVWIYFGKNINDDILFQVWASKKFIYIGQNDCEDYEIPQSVLENNLSENDIFTKLDRILIYSYGEALVKKCLMQKITAVEEMGSHSFNDIYKIIKSTQNDALISVIDDLVYEKTNALLDEKFVQFGKISETNTLREYKQLGKLINVNLNDERANALTSKMIFILLFFGF